MYAIRSYYEDSKQFLIFVKSFFISGESGLNIIPAFLQFFNLSLVVVNFNVQPIYSIIFPFFIAVKISLLL